MKKFFIVFLMCLTVCVALTLTSCTGDNDSVGIVSAEINDAGELILTYTDGTIDNLGVVRGTDGIDGKDGVDGMDGVDGAIVTDEAAESLSLAVSSGLRSAVSIKSNFTATVYTGGYFPGYGGSTTTQDYSTYGAGVIYRYNAETGSAFIITNYHVVYESNSNTEDGISDDINVYIYGNEYSAQAIPATYVGGSPYYDIAVLYVDSSALMKASIVKAATIGDSNELSVGDTAIAIGNPESYGISATSGVISVDSEYISMTAADNSATVPFRVMRIDTAVNSGNSGGGLFNKKGELIGIVNAKASSTSVENIGYAIPSNVAIAVADNIIDNCFNTDECRVQQFSLGITVSKSASRAICDENGRVSIIEQAGVYSVNDGGACDGILEVGDVIVAITLNGETTVITREYLVSDLMLTVRAGDTIEITVLRDGVQQTVSITASAEYISEY